jgi:hypothetical protein
MVRIKKKSNGPQSPKPTSRVTMSPSTHRMMRTKVDAARCAVHNMRREMEAKYVTRPRADATRDVIDSMWLVEEACKSLAKSLEVLGEVEHPEGIPDTV